MTLNERRFAIPDGLAELQAELESHWPAMRAALHASGVPLNDETDEEKAAREAREAAEAAAAAARTFTQAELDKIVSDRLARDRKDRPSDDEVAELREAKKKLDEQEAANATELEKATKRAEKAEADAKAATERVKETTLRSAILAEASKADRKIVDPEAALTLLDKSTLELDDDGTPKNIAQAMDALLEARPFLVGSGGTTTTREGAADQGARGGSGGVEQLTSTAGMSQDEIAKAALAGQLDTYMQTPK